MTLRGRGPDPSLRSCSGTPLSTGAWRRWPAYHLPPRPFLPFSRWAMRAMPCSICVAGVPSLTACSSFRCRSWVFRREVSWVVGCFWMPKSSLLCCLRNQFGDESLRYRGDDAPVQPVDGIGGWRRRGPGPGLRKFPDAGGSPGRIQPGPKRPPQPRWGRGRQACEALPGQPLGSAEHPAGGMETGAGGTAEGGPDDTPGAAGAGYGRRWRARRGGRGAGSTPIGPAERLEIRRY